MLAIAAVEKYVSALATGWTTGAAVHAGSVGDPWQLDEALQATSGGPAAGNRVNVKADGTYTAAGTAVTNGNAANPIIWQGYASAIGDLERPTRSLGGTGPMSTTGMPVITASMKIGQYSHARNLRFAGSVASHLLHANAFGFIYECSIENTSTSTSARAVSMASNAVVLNNDLDAFICVTADSGSVTPKISYNRMRANGNSTSSRCISMANARPSHIYGNQFWAAYSGVAEGVRLWSATQHCGIERNSFYGLKYAALIDAADEGIAITNNLVYGCTNGIVMSSASTPVVLVSNAIGDDATTDYSYVSPAPWNDGGVTLTANPYRGASTDLDADFRLNTKPGGGLAVVGAAMFGGDIGAIRAPARVRVRGDLLRRIRS